jgi:hypothetical protein
VTEYKLNHFTMADAQALAGKTADITEWDNDARWAGRAMDRPFTILGLT